MLGTVKAKLGFGETAQDGGGVAAPIGGFPTAGGATPMSAAKPVPTPAPAAGAQKVTTTRVTSPEPASTRDWTKMITRVKEDVERICNFLEALAKHPRGLQKYHEEAVRTVHDSWIDREGEQSLRRWVRSECSRIWPHKFSAIDAEKERARADIESLEELFGGDRKAPTPATKEASARAGA